MFPSRHKKKTFARFYHGWIDVGESERMSECEWVCACVHVCAWALMYESAGVCAGTFERASVCECAVEWEVSVKGRE